MRFLTPFEEVVRGVGAEDVSEDSVGGVAAVELPEGVDDGGSSGSGSFGFSLSLRRFRNACGLTFSLSSRTTSSSDFSDFVGDGAGVERMWDDVEERERAARCVDVDVDGRVRVFAGALEVEALGFAAGAGSGEGAEGGERLFGEGYRALVNASIRARFGVACAEESIADRASSSSGALFALARDTSSCCRFGCTEPATFCDTVEDVVLSVDCMSWRKLTLTVVVALDICGDVRETAEDLEDGAVLED